MIIRQALPQDAGAIAQIWNAEIRSGVSTFNSIEKSVTDVETMLQDRGDATQVAFEGDDFLGFVTFGDFRGGIGYRHAAEHTIYITPNAKGRGVGQALMTRIYEVARAQDITVLVAGISGENDAGIGFHKALGFEETGRMPDIARKFDRWMSLVLMQKKL
jgi:phosphinothricin acetyltransferase